MQETYVYVTSEATFDVVAVSLRLPSTHCAAPHARCMEAIHAVTRNKASRALHLQTYDLTFLLQFKQLVLPGLSGRLGKAGELNPA